jgi:threonylcarbamoyladenosine tRNA methylthiotransferase MtaB
MAFLEACAFSAMHVFPYSVRPGTRAAELPGQCEPSVKKARARRAGALARAMKQTFLQARVGETHEVLFEQTKNGVSTGLAGNYCRVCVPQAGLRNRLLPVRVTGVGDGVLLGELLPPARS